MLKKDFSIKALKETSSLAEISIEEPYIKLNSSLPPSFRVHCSNIIGKIPYPHQVASLKRITELRAVKFNAQKQPVGRIYSQPESHLWDYKNGFPSVYSTVLVCNLEHFPTLISEIEDAIKFIGRNLKKVPTKKLI